jgi:hypothetical protein
MSIRQIVVSVLVVTMATGILPARVSAEESRAVVAARTQDRGSLDFRASIDRVAGRLAADAVPSVEPGAALPIQRSRTLKQASGGGGSMGMILSLVGVAAGLATAYVVIKQTQKASAAQAGQ